MNIKGKKLAITGAILQLGLVLGIIGSLLGMIFAFQHRGAEGTTNTELLANDISFALISTIIGLCISIVGLIFIFIALFKSKYRAPWFFWFLIIWSILWILNFPFGTILGGAFLIYLIMHKDEFKKQPEQID